jgi:hypothetical protein
MPSGVDLVVWERPTVDDSRRVTEFIAMPRDQSARLIAEAATTGCAVVLFPVWAAVSRADALRRGGTSMTWPGGSVSLSGHGVGPWVDGGEPAHGRSVSGIPASLRGGLSIALAPVADGWSSTAPARRRTPGIAVIALVLASLVWGGARMHRIHTREVRVEAQRRELAGHMGGATVGGCTIGELLGFMRRAGAGAGDVVLDRVVLTSDGLTVTGSGGTVEAVHSFADAIGAGPGRTLAADGAARSFRLEVGVPCAR